MKSNKQLIDELESYFCTQDIKIVSRALANCMIDLNRIYAIKYLKKDEIELLRLRLEHNSNELNKFSENGPQGDLKMTDLGNYDS